MRPASRQLPLPTKSIGSPGQEIRVDYREDPRPANVMSLDKARVSMVRGLLGTWRICMPRTEGAPATGRRCLLAIRKAGWARICSKKVYRPTASTRRPSTAAERRADSASVSSPSRRHGALGQPRSAGTASASSARSACEEMNQRSQTDPPAADAIGSSAWWHSPLHARASLRSWDDERDWRYPAA
jgi:hypothetical protein